VRRIWKSGSYQYLCIFHNSRSTGRVENPGAALGLMLG
jgi:hypothetical protein